MKKQYIKPTTVTVKVETQGHLLNFSENADGTLNGGGSKGNYNSSSMSQFSRESDWEE